MKLNLNRLVGQLGVLLCLIGFVAVFLGWNGAASYPFLPAQFPYLISGGIAGLSLVVTGAAMLIVQSQRADRARLEAAIDRLTAAVERQGSGIQAFGDALDTADYVVAGTASYHRMDCHLPKASAETRIIRLDEITAAGELRPCRICQPPEIGQLTKQARAG